MSVDGTIVERQLSPSDARLVADCLAGKRTAWETLVQRYKRTVYSIPIKWGLSGADAAKIFRAVWEHFFHALDSLRDLESLQPWLVRVAIQHCRHLERSGHEPQEVFPADRVQQIIEEVERDEGIRIALRKLSPECQEIIRMLLLESSPLHAGEIAAKLNLSEEAVQARCHSCISDFKQALEFVGL
jgi:RNA polymerase sigma-70 factor (ECF subfamily)